MSARPDTGSIHLMVAPPKAPSRQISNKAPLAQTAGKVHLDCPICGIAFERYACWVKRKKICYCSKACADEARRRPVKLECVVCGGTFLTIPAQVGRVVTCSRECLKLRRSKLKKQGVLLPQGTYENARNTREKGYGRLSVEDVLKIVSDTRSRREIAAEWGINMEYVSYLRKQHRDSLGGKAP